MTYSQFNRPWENTENENFVIIWLKQYFDKPHLEEKNLKPILHFSLLWNLFENIYFTDDKHLTPKRLIELSTITFASLSDEIISKIFSFFQNRYFPDNVKHNRFDTLQLDPKKYNGISNLNFCQTIFTSRAVSKEDKLKCSFLVIHRFRNNLFHGRKNPSTLNIYEEPFSVINNFLIGFIEKTAESNALNKNRPIA